MQKTKIIIALAAIAALTLAAVGLAAAQVAQNQNFAATETPQNGVAPNPGFWGWIGNCFGYRTAEPYQGQYVAPPAGVNPTAPAPYQDGYGYGYGPCWAYR